MTKRVEDTPSFEPCKVAIESAIEILKREFPAFIIDARSPDGVQLFRTYGATLDAAYCVTHAQASVIQDLISWNEDV